MSPALRFVLASALALSAPTAAAQAAPPPRPAPAEPSGDGDVVELRNEARRLAEQALSLLDTDPAAARTLFERAEAKFHAPTHLLYLAEADAALGDYLLAGRRYQRLLAEPLPDYAPDAFRDAQRIGRRELDALLPKLALVRIVTQPPGAEVLDYRVDGAQVEVFDGDLLLAPGRHTIRVSSSAGSDERLVDVAPGSVAPLTFTLPVAVDSNGLQLAGIFTLSAGAAALVVGAVMGGVSISKVDQLHDRCPTKTGCNPEDLPLAEDARLFGDVSTGMLIAGGIASASGIVMLVIDSAKSPPAGPTPDASVEPVVGLGYVGVRGRF